MKNVLLVDDDSIFQFLGTSLLGRLGIPKDEVHTALNGKQALDLFNDYYTCRLWTALVFWRHSAGSTCHTRTMSGSSSLLLLRIRTI